VKLVAAVPLALLLGVLLVAGRFGDAVAQFSAPAFNPCPAAGVTVAAADGFRLTYQGRAGDDPAVCLVDGLRIFQNVGLDGDAQRRAALRELVPFQLGRTATTFVQGSNAFWREDYQVVDRRRILTRAGEFETWVLRYSVTNMTTGVLFGRIVAFLDVRTGMMVRRDVHFISGFDPSWPVPFEAIGISFNGPAS
jgi:hypothetical protein